jgi:hypothetical protein
VSLGKSALARGEPSEAERAYGEAAAAAQAAGLVHWALVGTINQVSFNEPGAFAAARWPPVRQRWPGPLSASIRWLRA